MQSCWNTYHSHWRVVHAVGLCMHAWLLGTGGVPSALLLEQHGHPDTDPMTGGRNPPVWKQAPWPEHHDTHFLDMLLLCTEVIRVLKEFSCRDKLLCGFNVTPLLVIDWTVDQTEANCLQQFHWLTPFQCLFYT